MTPADLIEIFLLTLMVGVGAPLLVGRLNRIEDKLERKADKEDIRALRSDLMQVALAVGVHDRRAGEG